MNSLPQDPRLEVIQQFRQALRKQKMQGEERPIDWLRIRVVQHLEWQLSRETVERLQIQRSEIFMIGQVLPTNVNYEEFIRLCKEQGFHYFGWGEERWASIYPIESLPALAMMTPETISSLPPMLASMYDITGDYPTDPANEAFDVFLQTPELGILDEKKQVVLENVYKLLGE